LTLTVFDASANDGTQRDVVEIPLELTQP